MKPLEEMGKFKTVVVDPPWPYVHRLGIFKGDEQMPFQPISLEQIKELPIREVADDDAFLFLWTVNRFVRESWCLMESWGFEYSFLMTWVKNAGVKPPGSPSFNSEFVVVGKVGKPQWCETTNLRTANVWARSGHSVKPEGFYDLLPPRDARPALDVFGRRRIAGFTSWGNEAP